MNQLNLQVQPGDIFGFIGHNGAGKSTTIKAVVGVLDFESGEILIQGHSIKEEPLICKRLMAYMPDNPDLYEHLTGIQYLNFIADIFAIPAETRQKTIEKNAELFEITGNLGDLISSYSHGEMTRSQKDDTMRKFADGEIQLLVSTVVIEVGIDIPNATVMVVENAERFGLAQLHQLRGRVGRGVEQSYCILISRGTGNYAIERGEIMASSNDGFYIAEKDLQLRGPGEFFGTKQHGLPELKLADLTRHIKILELAKKQATRTLAQDPLLNSWDALKRKVTALFEKGTNL